MCLLFLVGAAGFEPTASSSRTRRATNCAMPRKYRSRLGCGLVGDERIELPQVESESTALPLCKSPIFGFVSRFYPPLTRDIIPPEAPLVNRFFELFLRKFPGPFLKEFHALFTLRLLTPAPFGNTLIVASLLPFLREIVRGNEGS